MTKSQVALRSMATVLTLLLATFAVAAAPEPRRVLFEADLADAPTPVEAWDPRSPQELVRIQGKLYQHDAGAYYKVLEDHVTVRLADGVASWEDLLQQASVQPAIYSQLAELSAGPRNRLGVIDLVIPQGEPSDWSALLFSTGLVRYAEVASYGEYTFTPDDPQYSLMWHLDNTGQTGGTVGADISAELAWDLTAGSPSVIVAILDSGTAVDHPDLAPNVWHNEGETPNNGQDDDANGFIDDWEGWDFGNDDNDPRSNSFHGTHVTGVVNAAGDNGLGVIGLAGGLDGPGVRGMALGVGESFPIGSVLDDAILYAADNGADVITMSLSVGGSSAINDALDYAYNTQDVFIDCAAGNNGPSVSYPATRPEVMAVAATDHNDNRSSFSNPGPELEIAAPGSNIRSTGLGSSYGTSSGTSFSAPMVAALAGLIRSAAPGLSAPDVRQLIIDTSDDVETPGFDTLTGHGRINAYEALIQVGPFDGSIDLDADLYGCSSTITLTVEDLDLSSMAFIWVDVRSTLEPAGELAVLTTTGPGVFVGTLALGGGPPMDDAVLQVAHNDIVTAEYVDAETADGVMDLLRTDMASTDCQGPAVFGVSGAALNDKRASVGWSTDEESTGAVRYGETVPPTMQSLTQPLSTDHSILITGLSECTEYRYEVRATDALGNLTVDDNNGLYYSVATLLDVPGVGLASCQIGRVSLDRDSYGCNASAGVSLTDLDLDELPGPTKSTQVLLTSTTEPDGEWVTLLESAAAGANFEGTISLTAAPPAEDGLLSVSDDDLITATYFDEDDGQGQARVATFTSMARCEPPRIQGLEVAAISATRAEIRWTTDRPATARVRFGPDAALGFVAEELELKTSHSVAISAFDSCDRVHFDVSSADEFDQERTADAAGLPFQFNLNEIGGLVFHDDFESVDGWTLQGEFEIGTPGGLGTGSADPDAAFSGVGVLGTDLSGTGANPGDYEPGVTQWAYSPVFSAVGAENLELILRRKLGVSGLDTAEITVQMTESQSIWNQSSTDDGDWVESRYDLGDADEQPTVQLGFGINSGGLAHSYGWNIDELIVKDATQPDYVVCGGCAGAPSFVGLAKVYDAEPCGASGLTLEWSAAPAWGTGDDGTYDVHRGSTPEFSPGPGNVIASGITGTTYVDADAPVDQPAWYVVRARNNESCGVGGLADNNLVRRSATETTTQSTPASIGDSVEVVPVGAAHVRLSWNPVPGADHYIVRRSSSFDFSSAEEVGTTGSTLFEDVHAVNDGNSYAYRIFAANACGQEAP